jgi:Domain of Unknown Function (DUF1080)/FG-GAP-like repeat/FG-GAP repeat
MQKKIYCGILAVAGVVFWMSPASANKNFVPDWTFKGSSLGQWRTVGGADWRAENGEIVGTPKTAEGGWLIMDRPLQDTQFAATYRCTGGCKAGVMLRTETTPEGMKGVFVQLPDGQNPAASFALKLDSQGGEVSREALPRANGTVRVLTDAAAGRGGAGPVAGRGAGGARGAVPPAGAGGPAGAAAGRAGGRAGGFGGGALPADSPYTRPDYSYKPNEWNALETILDTNYLRAWVNDGPESGATNGRADNDVASYGPVALYVGGSGEVRFKQVEVKDLGKHVLPGEKVSSRFRLQRISDFNYAWTAAAADFNHDGIMDLAVGPYYYLGPDYQTFREIYIGQPSSVGNSYPPAEVSFAYDYTGDGWPDYVVTEGRAMVLYVNPKGALRRWDRYPVMPTAAGEIAVFKDIDGDGVPDAVFSGRGGVVSWASPVPGKPTEPWTVHQVSENSYGSVGQHGIGAGDINGDGRVDIVSANGWWEQPPKGTPDGPWPYHPVRLGSWPRAGGGPGGAEMGVYDVNGDGLNDVVTSFEAHGWRVGWYEQKRDKSGAISFVEHIITDDLAATKPGGVAFSEPHATTFADIDGDGIPDLVVGKRVYAHEESYNDPDPFGPGVLYWFRTVRNPKAPGGAEFKPELIHNRSGVGSTVLAVDLNKDGVMDIVTSTNRGTIIFWGRAPAKPAASTAATKK